MSKRQERAAINAMIFVVSALLIYMGLQKGWRVNLIPAQYIGYLVAALGVASVAGLNIYFKGELDPKNDAQSPAATDSWTHDGHSK